MGEAKNRGTFKQRRAAAIKRDKMATEAKLKSAARFKERKTFLHQTIMTPEERQGQFHSQVFISMLQNIGARAVKTK